VACHAEPFVHKDKFGTACADCHSTKGWGNSLASLGKFDHDKAAFHLTGKHRLVDCKSCHVNQVFKGTPQTCVGCHKEPPSHKGNFGANCAQCHTTDTWNGATFQHPKFSITHGRKNNTCATCHTDQSNFKTYTCYNCHEHKPVKIEKVHVKRKILDFQDCMQCHGKGHKGKTNDKKGGKFTFLGFMEECPIHQDCRLSAFGHGPLKCCSRDERVSVDNTSLAVAQLSRRLELMGNTTKGASLLEMAHGLAQGQVDADATEEVQEPRSAMQHLLPRGRFAPLFFLKVR
jgi:hypothetical protein